jgi:hypothetical protein
MPRTPVDYSKCVMYRIVCNDLNITDCYVGHTTNLTKRRCEHKLACNNTTHKHRKVYRFITEHGGFDNWSVIEIEKYPCDTHDEALKRERYWIEHYKARLNSVYVEPCVKCRYTSCVNCWTD